MTFSPDEQYLISANFRSWTEIWLWEINTGTYTVSKIEHSRRYQSLLFSPDGKKIVSRTHNGLVQLWDWQRLLEVPPEAASDLQFLIFSPDLSMIAALFQQKDITVWDTATGAVLRQFSCPSTRSMAFSPDSSLFAITRNKESVQVWHLHEPGFKWQFAQTYRQWEWVELIFSSDSQALATLGTEIRIWVRESGTFRFKTVVSVGQVEAMRFSPDTKFIATSKRDSVELWDCDTGQLVRSLWLEGPFRVLSLNLQPSTVSSYSIVIMHRDHVEVWDLETCSCIMEDDARCLEYIVPSRGTFIITLTTSGVRIQNWSTGEMLATSPWPLSGSRLQDYLPESSIVRTTSGDWALSLSEPGHSQLTQMFGVEPGGEWIQWKGHNLFKLPSDLRKYIRVAVIPGESLGFTVAIGSRWRGLVMLRFSNEGGMLDDIISR